MSAQPTIASIHACEILDSQGYPTIEASLRLDSGLEVTTSVPGRTTTNVESTVDLRDEDPNRFNGMGVTRAVSYINDLVGPKLKGVSPARQLDIDQWLVSADNTKNRSKLGANTILTISQLLLKASAAAQHMPLFRYINGLYQTLYKSPIEIQKIPTPIFNMVNGGRHANNNLEFQEFEIIPSSSLSFGVAYQKSVELFYELKKVLEYRNATTAVGEEGGFSPNLTTNLDALEILTETVNQRKMKIGLDVFLGIDIAASFFYKNNLYAIKDKNHSLKREEFVEFIVNMTKNYSILALEDPIASDNLPGWKSLTSKLAENIYIIGDEFTHTNKDAIKSAIAEGACTSILLKPNQIGTISELLDIVHLARDNNVSYVVAARSSETNDSFIADLAVGIQSEFLKFGAPTRGERVVKYNRLWQIEREELQQA